MSPATLESLDEQLLASAFFANPYPVYHQLREAAPVYWSAGWGAWVLTRYADVTTVLRDPQRFSSAGRIAYLLRELPAPARGQLELLERHYQVGIAHSDPPDHTRQRALLTKVFTPRMVEMMRPQVQLLVDQLLDAVQANGRMDIIRDLAYPLPATIIAGMIGAPPEDRDRFREWALGINDLFSGGGRTSLDKARRAQQTLVEMHAYIGDLAERRRAEPRDDILSGLVAAEQQGEKLSQAELVAVAVTLFVAGHETTTNLIGNGLLALLRNPEQLRKLQEQPELVGSATEELLRYDTPVQRGWRITTQDVEVGGQRILKGAMVLPMLGAANRDPTQFPDPDRLDITRPISRHFGFGHGIHFCLGAPLARLEVPVALTTLLRRFPNLRLDPQARLVWRHDVALRGLESLPVLF